MADGVPIMSEAGKLHLKAAVLVPPYNKQKPSTIMIGVMKLEKVPMDELSPDDFLWIKCHGRIQAKTIRDQFQERFKPDEGWILHFESKPADPTSKMADLDTYHDKIIIFEAVKVGESVRSVSRQPLQTTNPQAAHGRPELPNFERQPYVADAKPTATNSPPVSHSGKENRNLVPYQFDTGTNPYPQAHSMKIGMAPGLHDNLSPPAPNHPVPWSRPASRMIGPSAVVPKQEPVNSGIKAKEDLSTLPEPGSDMQIPLTKKELPVSSAEVESQTQKSFQIQTLLKDAGPQMLERSVEEGVTLLEDLKVPLVEKMPNHPHAEQWIQQIVGNTGAEKSSVINAMLDEERLVPTNCMRACTAVVTEISYNYEQEPYRAQIEFITAADWEKELRTLFQDLMDGDGRISRDCANEDTDAGIAYAKIKAVYPKKTKEDITNSSINVMLREVSHVLGCTRAIKETDSLRFFKKLQSYVDSKEKSTGKEDGDKKREPKQMEFWPLIRVVRIHVKSPALSTGAVIVDLPGVHDANAARAAVAEGYMKQCTGLWIVAPINRAVDDKAAKSLLGESFKRQLKMDGGYNAVTFICSKTDDISLEEAQDSLGLDDEMGSSWEEMDRQVKKQRSIEKQIEELQDSKATYGDAANDADEQIDVWDVLKDELGNGKTVFAPKSKLTSKKRKTQKKGKRSKKRRKTEDTDDEQSDFIDDESEESADESAQNSSGDESETHEPLSEERITAKLHDLRAAKKEVKNQRSEMTEEIKELKLELEKATEAENEINREMSAKCIAGRNQYSKGAIQLDFAAGIKELDQELAAEEDEDNFDPDAEARDYDEVARALPVFCVSSRAYQKLQGRLRKDPHIAGFTTIEETEIPQLQAHCEKLTENGRSANCRIFINKLNQLLNSLVLWASSDGTGAKTTPEQRARDDEFLQKGLKNLETGLEDTVKSVCVELSSEFEKNIFDKYETAVSNATHNAIGTVLHWGAKVNRDERQAGGYHWSTYKAICRRNGVYSNAQGPHEWNAKLLEPFMKVIASGWEKSFSRRLPMVMASFTRDAAGRLRLFHRDIEARAQKIGTSIPSLHMLQQQIGVYESNIKDLSAVMKDKINATQKDVNREFTPVIEKAMQDAYTACVDERGTGSFARMKGHMNDHVSNERHVMFQRSADEVADRLRAMIRRTKEELDEKVDEIFLAMRRDYRSVLGGGDVQQEGQLLPKAQRLVRKEMLHIIRGVEKKFRRVAGFEQEESEEEMEPTGAEGSERDVGGPGLASKQEELQHSNVKREGSYARELMSRQTESPSAAAKNGGDMLKDEVMQDVSEPEVEGSDDGPQDDESSDASGSSGRSVSPSSYF